MISFLNDKKHILEIVLRWILGLLFFIFGLNFFLNFIPTPPPSESMKLMFESFMNLKYILPLVKSLEVICGLMLLAKFCVPLALILLAPIVVNIAIIHFYFEPSGAIMAAFILFLMFTLALIYKNSFKQLFNSKF